MRLGKNSQTAVSPGPSSPLAVDARGGNGQGSLMSDHRILQSAHLWRDLALVFLATVAFALLSAHFELSEAVFNWTRARERYQLDELPGTLLVLASALAWFAWRRVRELKVELDRRRAIERELAIALDDNQRLARANVRIQEEERRVLARELHDELGQYVNAIKVDAVCIRDVSAAHSPEAHRSALAIIESADHVQDAVHEVVRKLRPPGLDELGLPAALEHCVDGWRKRLPSVRFDLDAPPECPDWGEAVNMTLYRVVQEGLTNVAKHAQAKHVRISLEQASVEEGTGPVVLRVHDDGVGASRAANERGLGLLGMRERVESLGGQLDAGTRSGDGFCLVATLPVTAGID
jgi:two-component system sensor histidine kinase UhpB